MNIIVKPFGGGLCYCRPDTTWERENKDFYSPECVNEVLWTPVVFARVCKAGKCIGSKFVGRYYDGVGCGILIYGETDLPMTYGDPRLHFVQTPPSRGWHVTYGHSANPSNSKSVYSHKSCISECIDHSSVLPMPLYNPVVLEDGEKVFEVAVSENREEVVLRDAKRLLEEAICTGSELTSLRIGDFVAVELEGMRRLSAGETGSVRVKGRFCENEIFDFNVIM